MTDYPSVFTRTTPTGNFLTADFKCFLTTTSRSKWNCRERLLQLNEEITQHEERIENIERFINKGRKYLDLNELTPTILKIW